MAHTSTSVPIIPWVRTRLAAMMFLQCAIFGAWLPLLWPFLSNVRKFSATDIGYAFAVGALGAIIAPFVAGQIADRYFNTEKFLGISHIVGGILVFQLASIESLSGFLIFSFAYSLVTSPTLPLTNSLSLHHIDRDRDFAKVRLWGTVGWIVVGLGVGQWLFHQHTPALGTPVEIAAAQFAGMADAFRLAGVLGVVMGLYCFTLPATPPVAGVKRNATFEALSRVRVQPLLVLFLLAVPISCIHQFYFVHAAGFLGAYQLNAGEDGFTRFVNGLFGVGGVGLMTIGQMSEIAVLALIPLAAVRWTRKSLLAVGIVAYALRMFLFAEPANMAAALGVSQLAILIPAIALHGVCFGCFIFLGFMIVDEETSDDVRASAQSLYNLVIVGIGTIVGSFVATEVAVWASSGGAMDYSKLFGVPMYGSLGCLAVLALFYQGGARAKAQARG